MHIETPSERPPELVASLVDVWERSVRATHDFLAEEGIAGLRPEVGLGVAGVAVLAVAVADAPDDAGRPFPLLHMRLTRSHS